MKRRTIIIIDILICLGIGVLAGLAIYTFQYAKGFSYFSNNPKACMNCHIMKEQYDSWTKSSHHQAATCNECHIPHTLPWKYIEKGLNGWNHSKAFTLQNYPDPIRITDRNLKVLQTNCIECHEAVVSGVTPHPSVRQDEMRCTQCHRSVGHMALD